MGLKDLLESDMSHMLNTDEFAVDGTYTPSGGVASVIKVIFDNEFMAVEGVLSSDPAVTCKTSDMPNPRRNEPIVIGAVTYYIREGHPDGTGMSLILLSRNQG